MLVQVLIIINLLERLIYALLVTLMENIPLIWQVGTLSRLTRPLSLPPRLTLQMIGPRMSYLN